MGSSGSQPQYLQKWRPTPRTLIASQLAVEGSAAFTQRFRVLIPDSRLRVKISIVFAFKGGQQPSIDAVDLSTGAATLWLYEAEDDDSGTTGSTYPCTNIEGTEAAPTVVPQAIGLSGYSREFITAGDNIEGRFVTAFNGFTGNWMLQLRYQPDNGQRFTDDEWREICNLAKPIVPPAIQII